MLNLKANKKIFEWIESQQQFMEGLVEKWATINSWSENLPGLEQMFNVLLKDFSVLV